jgi:riboflavin synthase
MFTGIIREIGSVRRLGGAGGLYKLEVACEKVREEAAVGDSVAVNGACLTVTAKAPGELAFDVMAETARRTTLAGLAAGARVNLEGALAAGARLDGHFVLGHVDCVGTVAGIAKSADGFLMETECPPGFGRFLVEKGSVAVDGVSLTVSGVSERAFKTCLIPHTMKATTLGALRPGRRVNIEFDIIGKYILKHAEGRAPGITESFLKEHGF